MEFAIQINSNGEWIPITLVIRSDETDSENVGDNLFLIGQHIATNDTVDDVLIREYLVKPVTANVLADVNGRSIFTYSVQLCDFLAPSVDSVQFRWLQTSRINIDGELRDVWSLEYVYIIYHHHHQDDNNNVVLLEDTFDDPELK